MSAVRQPYQSHPILATRRIRQIADECGLIVRIVHRNTLTDCQQDCLAVLEAADEPMTTTRILEELERREWLWGEQTVKNSLAALSRMGLIRSSRVTPRGYSLNDR